MASYTDKGGKVIGPLTGADVVTLRNAKVRTIHADAHPGFTRWGNSLGGGNHKSHILLKKVDLTGIKQFTYDYTSRKEGEIEVRLDSYAGPVISRTAYSATGKEAKQLKGEITTPVSGFHDLYFVVVKRDKPNNDIINLSAITFETEKGVPAKAEK